MQSKNRKMKSKHPGRPRANTGKPASSIQKEKKLEMDLRGEKLKSVAYNL